jgi:hypothetical protein
MAKPDNRMSRLGAVRDALESSTLLPTNLVVI